MSASPNVQVSVYPTAAKVLTRARTYINDAFQGGAGRILTNTASFSTEYLDNAQTDLQDLLSNNGVSTFTADNYLMLNIPAVQNPNPSIQCYIDYTGYFDGTQLHPNITLPQDCIVPLVLEERQSGTINSFCKMVTPMESLPSCNQMPALCYWEWRGDKIWLVGATTNRDLRLRYERILPPIQANANLDTLRIPIVDSLVALAWRVAYLFASARGAAQASQLDMEYQKAAKRLIVRYTRRDQRIQYRRKSFGRRGGFNPVGVYRS